MPRKKGMAACVYSLIWGKMGKWSEKWKIKTKEEKISNCHEKRNFIIVKSTATAASVLTGHNFQHCHSLLFSTESLVFWCTDDVIPLSLLKHEMHTQFPLTVGCHSTNSHPILWFTKNGNSSGSCESHSHQWCTCIIYHH